MAFFSNRKIKINFYIFLFITLFSFKSIVSEILPFTCEAATLNYSISLNLTKYLNSLTNNKSDIENKKIFEKKEDLKGKKGGIIKGTIFELIEKRKDNLNQFTVYDTYDEACNALNNYSIDYFLCYETIVGDLIQKHSDNLTYIDIEVEDNKEYMN